MRPIRNERDYDRAMKRAQTLAASTDKDELDELEVLYALVERWDRRDDDQFPSVTAIQAIRFRMDQLGLKPRELEPFIGSRARVSEVLTGTRTLTLDMIRALHHHLGIPARALIAAEEVKASPKPPSEGALGALRSYGVLLPEESWQQLIARAFGGQSPMAMLRKTRTDRTNAKTDIPALEAWCAAVRITAQSKTVAAYDRKLSIKEARELAKLSALENGLKQVEAMLASFGVILVVMPHLPGTYLDGAAMRREDGVPIIALTLRYDRIDNFWFTLLHEFGHVALHLRADDAWLIVDDLEVKGSAVVEKEADKFAQDALIPPAIWRDATTPDLTPEQAEDVASRAKVHVSIVAGRWQRTYSDYRRFSKLISRGAVRAAFERST